MSKSSAICTALTSWQLNYQTRSILRQWPMWVRTPRAFFNQMLPRNNQNSTPRLVTIRFQRAHLTHDFPRKGMQSKRLSYSRRSIPRLQVSLRSLEQTISPNKCSMLMQTHWVQNQTKTTMMFRKLSKSKEWSFQSAQETWLSCWIQLITTRPLTMILPKIKQIWIKMLQC